MDVTGKTAAEVEDAIMEQLKGYKLTINGREDLSESITGEECGTLRGVWRYPGEGDRGPETDGVGKIPLRKIRE